MNATRAISLRGVIDGSPFSNSSALTGRNEQDLTSQRATLLNTPGDSIFQAVCGRADRDTAVAAGTQRRIFDFQSLRICWAAFHPRAPVTPPPGCVPAPHR